MSRYYDDDDDEFDVQIREGSIEDAEELLARLDQAFVKSPYDIFARDDLLVTLNRERELYLISFTDGSVVFKFSNGFLTKNKGECYISIENGSLELTLCLHFISKNKHDVSVFSLSLEKNENTLAEFLTVADGGYSLGDFLATLEAMGLSFPNNFGDHLGNFISNCINTYNSLC